MYALYVALLQTTHTAPCRLVQYCTVQSPDRTEGQYSEEPSTHRRWVMGARGRHRHVSIGKLKKNRADKGKKNSFFRFPGIIGISGLISPLLPLFCQYADGHMSVLITYWVLRQHRRCKLYMRKEAALLLLECPDSLTATLQGPMSTNEYIYV